MNGEKSLMGRLGTYLWERKIWWLTPMILVFLAFGALVFLAQKSSVAPFVYVLF